MARRRRAPMSLRRRFLLNNLLLVGGLLAAGAASVWRLEALRGDVDLSRNVYAELRNVGNVAIEAGTVCGLLSDPRANRDQIVVRLGYAVGGLDQFIEVGKGYDGAGSDPVMRAAYVPINAAADSARRRLAQVLNQYRLADRAADAPPVDAGQVDARRKAVDEALDDLGRVAGSCIGVISGRQQAASAAAAQNLALFEAMSAAGALGAAWLSAAQDRRVMRPLQWLRRVAGGQFAERLDPADMAASPEFLDLADEFNRMAANLDAFHRRLEERVRAQSRELVRSERLASVGFLAAGVAHEINTPLNVISGHAELTARQVAPGRPPPAGPAADDLRESLRLIRDEAFRCKAITEKLLSLARGDGDAREPTDLSAVARDVAQMTRGLRTYRDCRVTVQLDPADPLEVQANRTEMKQVLLNLTINALEAAASSERGEVCIEGGRMRDWVELRVRDNGQGMDADVLERVFEPFFTARRGDDLAVDHRAADDHPGDGAATPNGRPDNRGTGLGLSITHAIVESHCGRIRAESPGVGLGACFTVQFPRRATT